MIPDRVVAEVDPRSSGDELFVGLANIGARAEAETLEESDVCMEWSVAETHGGFVSDSPSGTCAPGPGQLRGRHQTYVSLGLEWHETQLSSMTEMVVKEWKDLDQCTPSGSGRSLLELSRNGIW